MNILEAIKILATFENGFTDFDAFLVATDKTNIYRSIHSYYKKNYFDLKTKERYYNFTKLILAISNTEDAKNTKAHIQELYESCDGQLMDIQWIKEKIAELE